MKKNSSSFWTTPFTKATEDHVTASSRASSKPGSPGNKPLGTGWWGGYSNGWTKLRFSVLTQVLPLRHSQTLKASFIFFHMKRNLMKKAKERAWSNTLYPLSLKHYDINFRLLLFIIESINTCWEKRRYFWKSVTCTWCVYVLRCYVQCQGWGNTTSEANEPSLLRFFCSFHYILPSPFYVQVLESSAFSTVTSNINRIFPMRSLPPLPWTVSLNGTKAQTWGFC